MSSWPPFFVLLADSASRIKPAQVPQVGLRWTLYQPGHGQINFKFSHTCSRKGVYSLDKVSQRF